MGTPRLLVLVRHAESEGNLLPVDERASLEVATHAYPLTKRGVKQAGITGKYLRDCFGRFDAYYTSYYQRAQETMHIIAPDAKAIQDPRLAEAQRGIYHTMTKAQIEERYPEELLRKKREGLYHYRPFGGENWPDVELRIRSFLDTLKSEHDGQSVLAVIHGHWLLLFQRLVHSRTIEEALEGYRRGVVENASVTEYCSGKNPGSPIALILRKENLIPWEGELPKNPQAIK